MWYFLTKIKLKSMEQLKKNKLIKKRGHSSLETENF